MVSYLLAGPGDRFVPLAIAQALLLALCLTVALAVAGASGARPFWSAAVPLALATPAPLSASFIVPDIFAGLTILLLALLISQHFPGTARRPHAFLVQRTTILTMGQDIIISNPRVRDAPPLMNLNGLSLFLDLDGTLLELVDRPDSVVADQQLRALLGQLSERLETRLAVVSGRSIAQIDLILGPIARSLFISGSHGTEHRWHGISDHPVRPPVLDTVRKRFCDFAATHPGVLVEDKSFGVALHFRMAPTIEAKAAAFARNLAAVHNLYLQPGKMMIELRMPGSDKGGALREMMKLPPMHGTRPIFIGDDQTDEPAIVAAQALGGAGILVGTRAQSSALYALADPAAVRTWLEGLLT